MIDTRSSTTGEKHVIYEQGESGLFKKIYAYFPGNMQIYPSVRIVFSESVADSL